ncbi:hypothetical protein MHW47_00115 [Streptomyces sp. OfavH-34-F]|uniref:hypothetical protein n=1 Tax=Streptomyces sp. OfavH-34-F TaxID=2917760 RepID=UPI001EF39DEB|nr:hypothetical protein [Streptomyces sp. OfavH-34-F]MCG7522859.1 hypothetical protein [Streptomyces sp. OfavH-34-F]
MSESSPLQMFVYSVHESEAKAVLEVMKEEDLDLGSSTHGLVLGRRYGIDETPLSGAYDLSTALLQRAPSAVFKLWQHPVGEDDGRFVAHVPGVGTFGAGCDSEGTPRISVPELISQLADAPEEMTVREWLAGPGTKALGTAVLSALASYEEAHPS